jgi:hypothetical protein
MCKRKWQWFHEILLSCCNNVNCVVMHSSLCVNMYRIYEGELIIIRNAVAFVFLLAALSFLHALLGVVSFLSQLCRFEVTKSVPLSQPC